MALPDHLAVTFDDLRAIRADAPLRCVDAALEQRMIAEIDRAREAGDTVGGAFEVIARNVPAGLGSYVRWDRKLDGRLAQALMSIPAVKGVELGLGFEAARRKGSEVHDEIMPGFSRATNRAGGTADILDDHRLAERHPHALGHDARQDVGAAAGRERHDHGDLLRRKALRRRGARSEDETADDDCTADPGTENEPHIDCWVEIHDP